MKKVKFLVLAIVVTMALVGSAYAWWSQTLFAQGQVSSSNLYLNASAGSIYTGNDQCTNATCPGCCNGFPYGATAVNGVAAVPAPAGENNGTNNNQLTFKVDGAWPGYWAVLTYTVTNDGAVPWQFDANQPLAFTGIPAGFQVYAFNANGLTFPVNWISGFKTNGVFDPTKLPGLSGNLVCPPNGNIEVGILVYMPYGTSEDDSTMNTPSTAVTAQFHVTQMTPDATTTTS